MTHPDTVAAVAAIEIGRTTTDRPVALELRYANRHGLIAGATGTGKTVTLQRLAEGFSAAGVPVFAADIKGDLSGIATARPVRLWHVGGRHGLPVRTSVDRIGHLLMSRMLNCNQTQDGALAIAFASREDDREPLYDLADLRDHLSWMREERETVCNRYGNVTAASINAIQREILALDVQGGGELFGEPSLDVADLMQTTPDGRGIVSLLHADDLMESPRLYASLLMWLLTELFRVLPEAGDMDRPRMVFFFDEAHLLFRGAPPHLLETIERVIRLVRSKGVGVYFATQSPADVPPAVLAQLGNRIQHALRVYTPEHERMLRATARAYRPNPGVDVLSALTLMGVGEALVSCVQPDGTPMPVERTSVALPEGRIGPLDEHERRAIIDADSIAGRMTPASTPEAAHMAFRRRIAADRGWPEPARRLTDDEVQIAIADSLSVLSRRPPWRPSPLVRFTLACAGLSATLFAVAMVWEMTVRVLG